MPKSIVFLRKLKFFSKTAKTIQKSGGDGRKMTIRTDLAVEAKALWEQSAQKTTKLAGVRAAERMRDGTEITQVDILDERGHRALGKPVGTYVTLELPRYDRDVRKPAQTLGAELRDLLAPVGEGCVLVAGLGNLSVTPDALGPLTVSQLFLTRHLIAGLPAQFGQCRSVCAVAPGVLATTGIETLELVKGAVSHVRPQCVIAVDALAAGSMERLCRTVQFSNTGLIPGSGVGNRRAAFDRESLGIPVYSLGVPTVVDASVLCEQAQEQMIVTPRDIDAQVRYLSRVLAGGLNLALHPDLDYEDFVQFVPNTAI